MVLKSKVTNSDVNVALKESEKISKYGVLRKELTKMWNGDCLIIPVVVGALGAVSNDIEKHLKTNYLRDGP